MSFYELVGVVHIYFFYVSPFKYHFIISKIIFYLILKIFVYKALLFLGAGAVIHSVADNQDQIY